MVTMADERIAPTEAQRKSLCNMIAAAFVEIRYLGGIGNSARAADLADVFHNVSEEM
jgi:hypothetical protein